jgi:hypothetical protein
MGLLETRAPAPKFTTIGDRHGGTVTEDSVEVQQRDFDDNSLLFWDDGNPRMQLVVEYQGEIDPTVPDDDGVRTFYIKGDMLRAVKAAKRKAGLGRLPVIPKGSQLFVEFIDEEPPPRGKRGKPKKIYDAEMVAPSAEEVAEAAERGREAVARLAGQHERNDTARKAARPAARNDDDEPPF